MIGIDLGYYQVKTYDGKKKNKFVSVVGTPDVSRLQAMGGETDKVIRINGEGYLVGESAINKSRMRHRREDRGWIYSTEYKVLFYRALSVYPEGKHHVVTGLPNDFFADAPEMKKVLEGEHNFSFNDMKASYDITANVIMQPFGTLAYLAFDDEGNVRDNSMFELTGIIDVGGKTTNILTAQNFSDISAQTVSKDMGGWDVIRAVRSRLQDEYPKSALSDHQIATAITAGFFHEFGEKVFIVDILDEVLPMMAEDIISKASSLWGSGANLRRVVVTGGGSKLIGDFIADAFPHAITVDDPVFANAVGYYRFGKAVQQ